jgi:hypothetical protein
MEEARSQVHHRRGIAEVDRNMTRCRVMAMMAGL